jgi:spermine oxidase
MSNKSVIVIGAGVAGISASVKLIENGIDDVTILEAGNRIGGRLHSVPFGSNGGIIDMGGQWVSAYNEVYDIMKEHFEFGDTNMSEERKVFLTTHEENVDQEKCRRLCSLVEKIGELSDEMKSSEESYGEFFSKKFSEALKTLEFNDIDEKLAEQMLHHIQREFNAQYGSRNWNELPAKFFPEGDPGEVTMTWKTQGYVTLLNYLTVTHNRNIKSVSNLK